VLTNAALVRKQDGENQAICRSRDGLSMKIHALVDALGDPLDFFVTGGAAHDLVCADQLLLTMRAGTLIADKAFDADQRVLAPLVAAGNASVTRTKSIRSSPRCRLAYVRGAISD
jgi:transposase